MRINPVFFLFLLICIPLRFCAVLIAKYGSIRSLQLLGVLYMIFGIGIFIMYFIAPNNNEIMSIIGNKIWWHDIRPLFGIIWLLFGFFAINKYKMAWKILFIDVVFGLYMFLSQHNSYYI